MTAAVRGTRKPANTRGSKAGSTRSRSTAPKPRPARPTPVPAGEPEVEALLADPEVAARLEPEPDPEPVPAAESVTLSREEYERLLALLAPPADPEPPAAEAPANGAFPHYYHAYLPNLTIRRGRANEIRFRGGIYGPQTAEQEADVRAALAKYVPGGDPDRWKGDTMFDQHGAPREMRCKECGFFTANFDVFADHEMHTKH